VFRARPSFRPPPKNAATARSASLALFASSPNSVLTKASPATSPHATPSAGRIRASDLILVDHSGKVVEGHAEVNLAAFAIHSRIHAARPDVIAAAHAHSLYGKAWSSLGRRLDALTQDACAFYEDHVVFDDYSGVVEETSEGDRIAHSLGAKKAAILRNHGLLTVGHTVDEAAWWFITMDRSCQAQLLAEAAGQPHRIPHETAKNTYALVGSHLAGWFQFQPLWQRISRAQPDLFE
jgi:ribulose-5-phosphate 4-epimerase/fuculose-1-phosphate aldolase